MDILALSSKYSLGGIFCLASLLCLLIVILVYRNGLVFGSGVCATLCIISAICLTDPSDAVSHSVFNFVANNDRGWVTNESKEKWHKKRAGELGTGNAIFIVNPGRQLFIPDEEIMVVDSWKRMKPDGRKIVSNDYYIYDDVYPSSAVKSSLGEGGIPQWVWHPAAPIYIFGFFGLPALIGGAIINNKLR